MELSEETMVPGGTRSSHDEQLDEDVDLAGRTDVPVLITARPDRALRVAQAIASWSGRAGEGAIEICESSATDKVLAALGQGAQRPAPENGATTLLLREVHQLSVVAQEAVMRLFDAQASKPHEIPRIISTSSISLLGLVEQGTFDGRLFHRLNIIHVVVPPDRA